MIFFNLWKWLIKINLSQHYKSFILLVLPAETNLFICHCSLSPKICEPGCSQSLGHNQCQDCTGVQKAGYFYSETCFRGNYDRQTSRLTPWQNLMYETIFADYFLQNFTEDYCYETSGTHSLSGCCCRIEKKVLRPTGVGWAGIRSKGQQFKIFSLKKQHYICICILLHQKQLFWLLIVSGSKTNIKQKISYPPLPSPAPSFPSPAPLVLTLNLVELGNLRARLARRGVQADVKEIHVRPKWWQ